MFKKAAFYKLMFIAAIFFTVHCAYAEVESLGRSSGTGSGIFNSANFSNKTLQYSIVDGYAVVEGDIVLGTVEEIRNNTNNRTTKGLSLSGEYYRWPNGSIPYQLESNLPQSTRQKISSAIQHWTQNTTIKFIQRTSQNQSKYPDYVVFRNDSDGCAAHVGRRGGGQSVWLSTRCSTGNAIHEIGHTVGLWHEHGRENRNSFVRINKQNIGVLPAGLHGIGNQK